MDYIRTKASNVENAKLFGTEIGSGRQSEGEREKERERESACLRKANVFPAVNTKRLARGRAGRLVTPTVNDRDDWGACVRTQLTQMHNVIATRTFPWRLGLFHCRKPRERRRRRSGASRPDPHRTLNTCGQPADANGTGQENGSYVTRLSRLSRNFCQTVSLFFSRLGLSKGLEGDTETI